MRFIINSSISDFKKDYFLSSYKNKGQRLVGNLQNLQAVFLYLIEALTNESDKGSPSIK